MIQAWVTTPRGSLYYAAEATPYNLSHLRSHIRAMNRYGMGQLRVTVNLGGTEDAEAVPDVSTFLQDLAGEGIRVVFSSAVERTGILRRPTTAPTVEERRNRKRTAAPIRTSGAR